MRALNADRSAKGQPVLEFDLVLHAGQVLYGNIGARDRLNIPLAN